MCCAARPTDYSSGPRRRERQANTRAAHSVEARRTRSPAGRWLGTLRTRSERLFPGTVPEGKCAPTRSMHPRTLRCDGARADSAVKGLLACPGGPTRCLAKEHTTSPDEKYTTTATTCRYCTGNIRRIYRVPKGAEHVQTALPACPPPPAALQPGTRDAPRSPTPGPASTKGQGQGQGQRRESGERVSRSSSVGGTSDSRRPPWSAVHIHTYMHACAATAKATNGLAHRVLGWHVCPAVSLSVSLSVCLGSLYLCSRGCGQAVFALCLREPAVSPPTSTPRPKIQQGSLATHVLEAPYPDTHPIPQGQHSSPRLPPSFRCRTRCQRPSERDI